MSLPIEEVSLSGSLSKCLSISLSEADRPNPMSSAAMRGWFLGLDLVDDGECEECEVECRSK